MIELAFEGYQPVVQPGHIVSEMWMARWSSASVAVPASDESALPSPLPGAPTRASKSASVPQRILDCAHSDIEVRLTAHPWWVSTRRGRALARWCSSLARRT
jgi:hypothetical protein